MVEPGTRPELHRGNTVTVRTRSILAGTVPRFIKVYRLVFTGANRDSRSGALSFKHFIFRRINNLICSVESHTSIKLTDIRVPNLFINAKIMSIAAFSENCTFGRKLCPRGTWPTNTCSQQSWNLNSFRIAAEILKEL